MLVACKWSEFYIYDLYTALGLDHEAKGVYRRVLSGVGGLPRRHCRALAGGGRGRLTAGLAGRQGDPEAALAQVQAEQAA